ncbi:MAG TPA: MerR family transcriptional regulator [Gemmatimonadales bacterium]|nr:MerR family transcriptional regulator [Gemmatimonadales bacterium]
MNPLTSAATPRHPIGVAADRTGLSPDLLRIWERRYAAVTPSRSDGGQRLYSDADIERLRLLRLAMLPGRGIGPMARLGNADLAALVREDEAARHDGGRSMAGTPPGSAPDEVEEAVRLAQALDGWGLEGLLRRSAAVAGVASFLDGLAEPLLQRLDEEREAGRLTTVQQRLATHGLRRVLDGALLSLATPPDAPHLLVATPAGEREELDALLVATAAAVERWRVTYLGADLDASEIAVAAGHTAARAVGLSVTRREDRAPLLAELRRVRASLPSRVSLLVGGLGARELGPTLDGAGILVMHDLAALRAALRADLRVEAR